MDIPAPLRLRLDSDALVANWRALDRLSGTAACGAAIKADGYGLGAAEVAVRLRAAGCENFFVATWREAVALAPLGLPLAVLHGVRGEDMAAALSGIARPVLDTPAQVARWRSAGGGPCDVMIDTGINRLGLGMDDLDLLDGMAIDTLMSHLACADEDVVMNEMQRDRLVTAAATVPARRVSLANSAGIALGRSYAFDLTRPGLALYGGLPRADLADAIRQVVFPQAQVLQRRRVPAGQGVGYNATWVAQADAEIAIINLGYADGYARAFSGKGQAWYGDLALPIVGRVSMDLSAVLLPSGDGPSEGEWVTIDYDLVRQADLTARSPYELLTSLAHRFDRSWT